MPFTVADFHDLARLLYDHPEWRAELRRLVLTDEMLELPALVRQLAESQRAMAQELRALAQEQRALAEAQRRTEERVGRLELALAELAEAQRRTEERVGRLELALAELAEAQRRTEERVGRLELALAELAEAQRRTEERVGRLELALAELAEAQRRTEESLRKLSEAHAQLEDHFGQFQAVFGATVEDEASGVLRSILQEKGYRPLAEPFNLALDGEVDVVLPVATPEGHTIWAVVEAKARLSHSQVRTWAQRMKSEGWRRRLAAQRVPGPFLVYAFGIRVDRSAIEEAERQGIGLLTGQGERVAPKGLVGAEAES
jgi:hypothetical protein